MYIISFIDSETGNVITRKKKNFSRKNIVFANRFSGGIDYLYEKALEILSTDIAERYTTYYKKKRNGTFRRIDIPDENLKEYMHKVNDIFINQFNFVFPSCVCAYVKHRSIKDAATPHAYTTTIYKFDISDFFGSCTFDTVMGSLMCIYPFCLFDKFKLATIIQACMVYYDGELRLPQGAPSSPIISNLTMIPIDFKFSKIPKFSYTRYADDLFFSVRYNANIRSFRMIYEKVDSVLDYWGFTLNGPKCYFRNTRCGNLNILGISVGLNYSIKIGNTKKQHIKAQIWNFMMDTKNGKTWSKKDVECLEGRISHYRHIEPGFIDSIIQKYEIKTNISYKDSVKNILCS